MNSAGMVFSALAISDSGAGRTVQRRHQAAASAGAARLADLLGRVAQLLEVVLRLRDVGLDLKLGLGVEQCVALPLHALLDIDTGTLRFHDRDALSQ